MNCLKTWFYRKMPKGFQICLKIQKKPHQGSITKNNINKRVLRITHVSWNKNIMFSFLGQGENYLTGRDRVILNELMR